MYNTETPPNLSHWNDAWRHNKKEVTKRIRIGDGSANEIWDRIRNITRHPLADREVWLFLGNIFSKSVFESNISADEPVPESIQAAFLLHSTMTNVASIGAKLRVFCYP